MTTLNPELTAAQIEGLAQETQTCRANLEKGCLKADFIDKRRDKNNSTMAEDIRVEQTDTDKTNANKKTPGSLAMPLDELSMDEFLQSVERRAFHMARMATGSRDDALDIVQDAMFKLVEKYSAKSVDQWRPLFYRILNRKITDHYRRNAVKKKLFSLASLGLKVGDKGADLIDRAEGRNSDAPDQRVARALQMEVLSNAIARLPGRQRQAFTLRCWDGMSTAITAETMGCSQGSVKTHYSRAIHSLRASLKEYGHE
ncbi:putative RNA polymerase sigma factor FecI [Gammaproteobacteria bacterium MOLA455]|nr:putative RNA polymerase sigma factor FecI [Gammaproteobacteria bacterium MOLA455]